MGIFSWLKKKPKQFKKGQTVYMGSQFGTYVGKVLEVTEDEVTVGSSSCLGGYMVASYKKKGIRWVHKL